MSAARIVADRLYGIQLRPQELALYGEQVRIDLRYAPVFEDPEERTATHYKLLVCEISATLPADDALRRPAGQRLLLLKCGWELELATEGERQVGSLAESPDEMKLLLDRIAETVNDLARRARLEAPLGPEVVERLLADYRAGAH
jgi:hypothetical protein